ncbi:MAG: glycosyltransferase, partial [Henriciella sp.]|nr:glycosyltransferase [Henriciella sp.]
MNTDLKVLMLSASDSKGGAAKVAQYTAVGLQDRGVSVEMLVSDKQTDAEWVKQLQPPQKHRLLGKIEYRAGVNALNLATKRRYNHIFELASEDYDVVHLHDLPAGLNILDLAKILRHKNVVWTIHSMAPLTGNCVFSFGCDRWMKGCHDCPQFGTWPLIYYHRDASAWNW